MLVPWEDGDTSVIAIQARANTGRPRYDKAYISPEGEEEQMDGWTSVSDDPEVRAIQRAYVRTSLRPAPDAAWDRVRTWDAALLNMLGNAAEWTETPGIRLGPGGLGDDRWWIARGESWTADLREPITLRNMKSQPSIRKSLGFGFRCAKTGFYDRSPL